MELNFQVHDNGHSILSPSGWSMWSKCTGSMVGLNEARKVATDNLASVEGTTAHILLEIAILTWTCPSEVSRQDYMQIVEDVPEFMGDIIRWRDKIVGNINNTDEVKDFTQECFGQIIRGKFTSEMRIEIKKCYDRIKVYKDDGWTVLAESKVSLRPFFGHDHSDGSADVIMYKGSRLIVADLKYGKGIEVSPNKNGQLSIYAGGAIGEIGFDRKWRGLIDQIDIVIMQPRINNGVWKTWVTNYEDLYDFLMFARGKSEQAIEALQGGKVTYNPSESACQWCHRSKDCKARVKQALTMVQEAFASAGLVVDSIERPKDISVDDLADILDRTPFIVSFLKDMGEEAEKRAKGGEIIPRRKLVKGRSSRKWSDEDVLMKGLADAGLFAQDFINLKVKSPAQMEKVLLTDEQKAIVKSNIIKTFGGEALVSESDPRPAVVKNAALAFEQAGVVQSK